MSDEVAKGRCPVDFNQHSPQHAKSWPENYQNLRQTCPRAWTDTHGGYWVATKYMDIIRIGQNPERFFVKKTIDPITGEVKGGVAIPALPGFTSAPNESDPPEWNLLRNFLNHRFGPKAAEDRRERTKQFAAALIDMVIETGKFDIVDDLANPLPALTTMDIFGFPIHEWRKFADPFHKMVYTPKTDPEFMATLRGLDYYKQRLEEELALRRKNPTDDFLSYLVTGEIEGARLSDDMIRSIAFNVLAGGIDTTTALTSNTLLYLSRHPDQRQQLIDDPDLLPKAREEFLRYFSPIHGTARNVKEDMEFEGWELKKNERVLLSYASANRDEEVFEDPEIIKLDRFPNRHIAFGAGQHRCIGSFFARMMFEVMLTEVLERMPDYQVVEKDIRAYTTIGDVNGWITIPAKFTPGTKVGATLPDS
jgi:cytochrome P450